MRASATTSKEKDDMAQYKIEGGEDATDWECHERDHSIPDHDDPGVAGRYASTRSRRRSFKAGAIGIGLFQGTLGEGSMSR